LARFRADEQPSEDTPVEFRIVRVSSHDGERSVADLELTWRSGTGFARIATNFQQLNLVRPERLFYRVDWRLPGGNWVSGPSTSVDVIGTVASGLPPGPAHSPALVGNEAD
jgi:hypothetical protein